jgi:hypothetical protein
MQLPADPLHLANSPSDVSYCGEDGDRALFLDEVTCTPCLHAAILRASSSLSTMESDLNIDHPDRQDLKEQLREVVERLGELSLRERHPQLYDELMMEKRRPEEPLRLGAIVMDARGVHFLRESVSSIQPWREFGAVRLGIEGEDDKRWEDIPDVVKVVFGGIE